MIKRGVTNLSSVDFESGETILIDKPLNWTSFKVIHSIRKVINVKKVGHAGTLDPKATGLLIVCTGKRTKEINKYQDLPKVYTGTITLGKRTSTMDSEGEVIEEKEVGDISEETLLQTRELFIGEIDQIPPMHSAVNYGGKKLYQLARKGRTVVREPRKITVYSFRITKIQLPEIQFEIECSKGTYIRVIAEDFGNKIGCGAYLSELRRTKIGIYSVEDALEPRVFSNLYKN
ncbi:MAG TPA: tRNA pseudouridine(55) synthase TruB [Ignavibacteriaceae bacterium]|nr:tRNA pseudouridine(55) synthase TruB [Ignavibacteriaceae bacterium]